MRENFFSANHRVLGFAGLMSPNSGGRNSELIFLIKSRVIMSLMLYYGVAEWVGFTDSYQDKYDFSKCLNLVLCHTVGIGKEIFVLWNMQKIKQIMMSLDSPEFNYGKCQEKDFDSEAVTKSYRQIGKFTTYMFMLLGLASATSGFVPPLVDGLVSTRSINGTDVNSSLPKLPYFIWTPFEPTTRAEYLLGVIYQYLPIYYHVFGILGVDALSANIMNCVAMNLTLIQKAFFTLRERCTEKVPDSYGLRDSPELSREQKLEMRKICRHLQNIYKVCDDLENMNNYIYFFQFGGSMFNICSSLYLALNTPFGDKKIIHEFFFLTVITVQLLLYCWFGNEVKLKAEEIPLCIWESDWISMDNSLKKEMILTMARTNVPLILTAGKLLPLTLETFMQICKGSYSFYTFMRSLQ